LFGGPLLSGLLGFNRILSSHGLRVRRKALVGTFHLGLRRFFLSLSGLRLRDGLDCVRFFALVSLGLLELPLGGQGFVTGHSA